VVGAGRFEPDGTDIRSTIEYFTGEWSLKSYVCSFSGFRRCFQILLLPFNPGLNGEVSG